MYYFFSSRRLRGCLPKTTAINLSQSIEDTVSSQIIDQCKKENTAADVMMDYAGFIAEDTLAKKDKSKKMKMIYFFLI